MIEELDYYIPPDVPVNADGTIDQEHWPLVYRFDDDEGQFLASFTGMGMPPIRYIQQTGPLQHGSTILNYRLQQRVIQYLHRRNATCNQGGRQGYWDARGDIINLLRPNRQCTDSFGLGRLRKIMPDGTMRDFDAIIQRGPVFQATSLDIWDEWSILETLRFICPDPTAYDPDRVDVTWTSEVFDGLIFYAVTHTDHLVFPNNAIFASGVLGGTIDVTYVGTWLAYPIIYIMGPLSQPAIENKTLGLKIELDYIISAGEQVIIDTTYGNKTIENFAGTNLIGTITDDSDLNLNIAPDPIAANGINQFTAYGAGAVEGETEITMTYFTRYVGI